MITENLSTLKIHKLTQRQYDREVEAGRIDENALYLIPDESGAAIEAFEAHIEDSTKHIDSTERTKWDTASTTASSAQTKANEAYALAEGKVSNLADLGISATATELNYVDGVKSNVQTQLDAKVPTTRKINDKVLSGDIELSASDVGAYAKSEIDTQIADINTSITNITNGTTIVKKAEAANTAGSATTAGYAINAGDAATAGNAVKAKQDGNGNVISDTYETKTAASSKLAEAKTYTDNAVSNHKAYSGFFFESNSSTFAAAPEANGGYEVTANHNNDTLRFVPGNDLISFVAENSGGKDEDIVTITVNADPMGSADEALVSAKTYTDGKIANLLNNSSEAVDSIMELAEAMEENADVVEALESAVGNKVDKVSGKGLSTNDLTATLKTNYDAAYSHVSNKNNPHGVTLSQLGVNATATELNYVDGVTSGIQSQLDAKVPTSRTVNGKALSSNITLSASDVGADSAGTAQSKADAALLSAKDYTDGEISDFVGDIPVATQIETAINAIPQADLAQTDPLAPDYIKNKPTNEDIVQMLMEMDIVQPVSDANNVVYADIDGKAFVL